MQVKLTGRTGGEYVANKGTFDECSCGKRLAIESAEPKIAIANQTAMQLIPRNPRRKPLEARALTVPSGQAGLLTSVDPDFPTTYTRYDSRGNKLTTVAHTDTTRTTTAVVPATVVYALMVGETLVGVARESEIEAMYDLMSECHEGLEIVPCQ